MDLLTARQQGDVLFDMALAGCDKPYRAMPIFVIVLAHESQARDPDFRPDAASITFKFLIGAGVTPSRACVAIGPAISLLAIEFDTTGIHGK